LSRRARHYGTRRRISGKTPPDKDSQKCYLPYNSTPSINSPKVFRRSETTL
jgi:hypothetical protein